jgi:adenylate cyclase
MMKIPALIRDLFHGQSREVHPYFVENPRGYIRINLTWRYGCFLLFIGHVAAWLIFYNLNVPEMVVFNTFSVLIFITAIFLIRVGFFYTGFNMAMVELFCHAICSSYFVGLDTGYNYYLLFIPFAIFLNPLIKHPFDITVKAFWLLATIVGFIACGINHHYAEPVYQLPEEILISLQVTNMVIMTLGISITALLFGVFLKRAEDALRKERDKSERLLHNILPVPIANRLKEDDKNPVDGFNETSILFADIVGFTPLSESCTPEVLVGMLNDVFSRFDDLADKHGLEKIKTIGDAYMVAAGIPEYRKDHATAIADMAIDMVESLKQIEDAPCQTLSIRVGINSGPAVAGVIGKRKFAYDLWGDTVNTAARMESHGVSGKIQVTEDTYNLLKADYSFVERGVIEIKGKGSMKTFFLNDKAA